MKEAHELGTPPMRPLFYDFPEQTDIWDVEDEYMFGGNLLIAPVLYENTQSRKVVLPKGRKWICANTKKTYEGGQTIYVETPMDIIPVFTDDEKLAEVF